jgi:hypothetical protein
VGNPRISSEHSELVQNHGTHLTETLAVLRGDIEIKQEDIDTVAMLSNWINYDFKEL